MNTGKFSISDLIQVYAPANLHSVMLGNKVMLRSGGPEMTVYDIAPNGDALCQWVGATGKLQSAAFPLVCLTCYGAK